MYENRVCLPLGAISEKCRTVRRGMLLSHSYGWLIFAAFFLDQIEWLGKFLGWGGRGNVDLCQNDILVKAYLKNSLFSLYYTTIKR